MKLILEGLNKINCEIRIKTNTVHWVTPIYVYYYAAPTCFGTYVPSSGSVFVLVSYVKTEKASGNVNCVICVQVLWCYSVLCFPAMHDINIKLFAKCSFEHCHHVYVVLY
jgi:hypothetical protein